MNILRILVLGLGLALGVLRAECPNLEGSYECSGKHKVVISQEGDVYTIATFMRDIKTEEVQFIADGQDRKAPEGPYNASCRDGALFVRILAWSVEVSYRLNGEGELIFKSEKGSPQTCPKVD